MASIDANALFNKMVSAASTAFKDKWPGVKSYAETELKKIAVNIASIEAQRLAGKMTEEQARLQFRLQTNASKTVLLAAQGMTTLVVEAALNAALGVIKDTVNTALSFVLL